MKNRLLLGFLLYQFVAIAQVKAPFQVFVSPFGKDLNANGSAQKPLASIDFALKRASSSAHKNIEIHVAKGVYYLDKTIVLSSSDFTDKQLTIIGNGAVISAGQQLNLKWTPYDDKIWQASLDTDAFDQLFINRTPQILARYPNYDASARNFNGTVADALDKVKTWKNPAGVFVHGLHEGEWGSFHYQITAIKNDKIMWEGGWQNNRPAPLHKKYCFVENAFEALDSPNEWYFDKESKMLYYYPDKNLDLNKAKIVISRLKHSIEIVGTEQNPIKNISIRGLRFMHNERTFMQAYEPLLRSDWRIYRGGAIVLENTENCTIIGCEFSDMGGNSVFFSRYNQHSSVKSSHFHDIGASAICFVGDTSAVRSATFQYDFFIPYENLDKVAGPKNEKYPRNCTASDNLIYRIGKVEKQSTGVHIEMASEIEVSHNTIYEVPRAGINIGSGCWGGHKIANNDVFDTVLETGDHGAFNSWGRDRFWHPDRKKMDEMASAHPELILLDMVKPTQIYGNRFRCDHGWDIDLDDGSSNYQIYNNVCLNGGLKLREGFYRKVENNVLINNSFHPHVWFKNSGDAFRHNIIQKKYFPILVNDWGNKIDQNLFPDDESLSLARKNETDKNSQVGNPQFVAANKGNYQVAANSPALQIGFKNFPMNDFGVKSQKLKYLARKPVIPDLSINQILANKSSIIPFLGGEIKSIEGLGERSAYGLPDETGVLVVSVNQFLTKSGLQKQDVIRMADGIPIKDAKTLLDIVQSSNWKPSIIIEVLRNQQLQKIVLSLK